MPPHPKPTPGKMPRRGEVDKGVRRIPDPHHPRGYREVCSKAAWDRRRIERAELANYRCECMCKGDGTVTGCYANAPVGEAHHLEERKIGGGFRDDHIENLRWTIPEHHQRLHVPERVIPRKVRP